MKKAGSATLSNAQPPPSESICSDVILSLQLLLGGGGGTFVLLGNAGARIASDSSLDPWLHPARMNSL